MINRLNETIAKLRHEASAPIKIKINDEKEKLIDNEKKLRDQKAQTHSAEEKAMQRRKEEYAAIKAMNKELGNPSYEIRYGSPRSIEQGQKFNQQLEESTRRINRLADAQKHIRDVSKAADVKVSPSLAEKLATQTVNKTEKGEIDEKREAINLEKQRIAAVRLRQSQEEEGAKREIARAREKEKIEKEALANKMKAIVYSQKLKDNNAQIEASAGAKAQLDIERKAIEAEKERIAKVRERQAQEEEGAKREIAREHERIAAVRERQAQEEDGARRVAAMERETERQEQAALRKQKEEARELERAQNKARRERENELASARTTGLRGLAGEGYRDIRRNMIYGAIGQGEQLLHEGYDADKARDTAIENVRQAGRTPTEIRRMEDNARKLSLENPTVNASELMMMQQHNIGAFGDVDKAFANNSNSAKYLATRKGRVGEDTALDENLAILKIGEETGRIRDQKFMDRLYDQQAKLAQAEGAQYDPKQLLTMVRQMKSSKFGISDEAMLNVLPFIGIGEGMSRVGNQVAMLSKSMTFAGKSITKQNEKEIAGTSFSNGKGGYNPEIQEKFAAGDLAGVGEIVETYLRQKGFNPDDKSDKNINKEINQMTKTISNSSAREALFALYYNKDQIEKQQRNTAKAQGINVPSQSTRTVQGAEDALKAQAANAAAEIGKNVNPLMIRMENGVTRLLEQISKHANDPSFGGLTSAGAVTTGLGISALTALLKSSEENPGIAANTAATLANTGATVANTGALAASDIKGLLGGLAGGSVGLLSKLGIGAGVVAGIYDVKLAFEDLDKYMKLRKLKEAAKTPEGIDQLNKDTRAQDQAELDRANHAKDQISALSDKDNPKLQAFIAQKLKEAEDKINQDAAHPFVYKKGAVEDDGVNHDYGKRRSEGSAPNDSKPIWHTQSGKNDLSWKSGIDMGSTSTSIDKSAADAAIAKIGEAGNQTATAMSSAGSAIQSAGSTIESGAGAAAGSISSGGAQVAAALSAIASQIAAVKIQGPAAASNATTPTNLGAAKTGPR